MGITNICNLLQVGTNQLHCAVNGEQWQQWWQPRSGTMIPLTRTGCVTGIVVIIIIVTTVSAYVAAAVPDRIVAVAAVVVGTSPSAALIVVLPMSEGCAPLPLMPPMPPPPPMPPLPTPMRRQCTTLSTPPRELVQSGRIAVRRREKKGVWQFFLPQPPPPQPPPPAVIVQAGIAPAFAGAVMVTDKVG